MKRLLLLVLLLTTINGYAQQKFSYDEIKNGTFRAKSVRGVRSMNDGNSYTTQEGDSIVKYSYQSGNKLGVIFNNKNIKFSDYKFSSDEKKILLTTDIKPIYRHSYTAEHYVYDIANGTLAKLSDAGPQQVATISPDGKRVAFVRENNLFWVDLASKKETQITTDGKFGSILNGIPDWVYEEEYSFSQAYQWSPESDAIAFYRTDESRVKQYHMNMFNGGLYPTVYSFKYPKAGEENSIVTIHSYNLNDGKTITLDTGTETDQYIPRIKWSAKKDRLVIFRLNRLQNNFDLLYTDTKTGKSEVIYSETSPRYIERIDDETITFLPDGERFILKSEKDGYMHLYLYSFSKGLINQITKGNWEVTNIIGVNDKNKLYYLSCEGSPLRRNLYSINFDGGGKKRITENDGMYSVIFSNGFKYFISYFSNVSTPNMVTLHTSDGKLVRTLEDNAALKETLKKYTPPVKEFFTFTTSEGIELNGYMVKPNNFDPTKEHPLFMTQYSGPGSQSVSDHWSMGWEDALVQEGYIVACVDGRGTGFRGEDFKKCTYKDMGRLEVIDQTEAAKYLGSLPYIDKERIAIYGWSYGGFMSLNCILQSSDVFKVAIAVAPVTSWRYYDTIYTELYNGLPQDNPSGYDDNSPITHASKLKGKLLLAHGTGDDNVHIQNSYEMISAFAKHNIPFETAIYPDQNHGMGSGRNHLMYKCIEFIKTNL